MIRFFILLLLLLEFNLCCQKHPNLSEKESLDASAIRLNTIGNPFITKNKSKKYKNLIQVKQIILPAGQAVIKMAIKNSLTPLFSAFISGLLFIGFKLLKNKIDQLHEERKIVIDTSFRSRYKNNNLFLNQNENFVLFNAQKEEELQKALHKIKQTKAAIKSRKKIMYRNLLMYGPSDSGKSLFAWRLAKASGMNFIMLDGFLLARKKNLPAMKKLFNHIKCKKNLIILVKNVDALFDEKTQCCKNNKTQNMFTDFLQSLHEKKSKIMLIMTAENSTVIEKIRYHFDDVIQFSSLNYNERIDLLNNYFNIENSDFSKKMHLFDEHYLGKIALKIDNFSCIDLANFIKTIKNELNALSEKEISPNLIGNILKKTIEKSSFLADCRRNTL